MPEPSEGARRAADRIAGAIAIGLDGHRIQPDAEEAMAQIIDSETRCGELRKALEECASDLEDALNMSTQPVPKHVWDRLDRYKRNALNGGPQ